MMYRKVEGELLRTIFSGAPQVSLSCRAESTKCTMRFSASALDAERTNWQTILRFIHVLDFRFYDWELGLPKPNPSDVAFDLIELESSDTLDSFASTGALQRTAMPVTKLSDLRHYRITFDDHGTYDIVCTRLEVAHERVRHSSGSKGDDG
jgi:hypothetical protein